MGDSSNRANDRDGEVKVWREGKQFTEAIFGLSGDSLVESAAAKVPFWQKEIPVVNNGH
jgi:hypothetical protein